MSVLVAYASAHGSTKSIARRIAAMLSDAGLPVEVRPFDEVETVEAYEAFVLGSAVHNMRWLVEATEFTDAHQALLAKRPTWLFSVGMPAALPAFVRGYARRKEEERVSTELRRRLSPRDHHLFSGVVRPEHLGRAGTLAARLLGVCFGDHRNPGEVEAWATSIARTLTTDRSARS